MIYGIARSHVVHRVYGTHSGISYCGRSEVAKLRVTGAQGVADHLKVRPNSMCRTCFDKGHVPWEIKDLMK